MLVTIQIVTSNYSIIIIIIIIGSKLLWGSVVQIAAIDFRRYY